MTSARVAPHNQEAEAAIIGAVLYSRQAIAEIATIVNADDFYVPAHQRIYEAVIDIDSRGQVADPISVSDQLAGAVTVADLTGYTIDAPSAKGARRWAEMVARDALMRRVIAICAETREAAESNPADGRAVIDTALQQLYTLTATNTRNSARHAAGVLTEAMDEIEAAHASDALPGVPTGLVALDAKLTGLHPGELITLAGRPSMGKSAATFQFAAHAAGAGVPTLLVSVEMPVVSIAKRLLANEAPVDHERLRTGNLHDADWTKLAGAASRLADTQLWFLDAATATLSSLRAEVRRLATQVPLGLVVVDYLQLLLVDHRRENRQVEVAEIATGLKRMAREFQVPVLAAAQLSRNLEYRADKRPVLADLRESGAIEQESDVVIGLYRDDYYNPESADRGLAEFIVLKQRNGPTGTVQAAWLDHYGRFANMAIYGGAA